MECSTPGFPVLHHAWSLLKLMSIESVMPSNHRFLCHPLLLLPSVFPSIKVFSNEPALHIRWLKYWRFSFSISTSNEYSQLISFRIDWFHLLVVQGTLVFSSITVQKHLFFGNSVFFVVPLSHPYMTTEKNIVLTMWTFVSKAMSLLLGWCTGKTQRDGMEREVGGGIGMGNPCKSMADSCQCMAKTTTIL
ncbi:unnamed protein product [Rangifer tarandus platyrhynchus]|uniref:Uncharacterized protein n=2 Tax=Rangifer tarandus platyrhynchus TaxID=3082113 RepID=A0ABN8ZCG1_RANTA|nr:unnamed protein product [Rangifer tarandus platyrhynchus]